MAVGRRIVGGTSTVTQATGDDRKHIAHYTHLLASVHARLDNQAVARGYYASACAKLDAFYTPVHPYVLAVPPGTPRAATAE